ncbi:MAG: ferrous iron transport protein B [Planctomycetota bacterium]
MSEGSLTVALAGNPNSGKTTVFNAITGARQHVGNYPGVTVERKEGRAFHDGVELNVVDLPGTYSLTAYSIEEIVARNFIIDEAPDVVIDIVDASNIERNLYLATQLIELGVPLVLAFNMSDVARSRGYGIDVERLSALLSVPIVETVGHKKLGIKELLDAAVATGRHGREALAGRRYPDYGAEIEPHVRQLSDMIAERCEADTHTRWYAIKLLENDGQTIKRVRLLCGERVEAILAEAGRLRRHIERICGDSAEIILADRRYGFISGACTDAVTQTVQRRHERSDMIDAVMTNRWLGLPIFALLMYLVFQMTFALGNPIVDFLDDGKQALASWVIRAWPGQSVLRSLLVEGVIEGVGAVIVFVPLIALLFVAISILEDSGYMARAAFVIDRQMHRIGLHGKSFIPMLIGFGCTVPGIMATRTLASRRDRLTTMMILPLMSCGARLPVYVLILGAFFPKHTLFSVFGVVEVTNQALLLFLIYGIGIALAMTWAKLFRRILFRGETTPFVMELPPYRMPSLKGIGVHVWERTWMYLRKAGTIILAIVVLLWALKTWPPLSAAERQSYKQQRAAIEASGRISENQKRDQSAAVDRAEQKAALGHSAIGHIGKAIAPILRPCGFDWKVSTALIGAFAAKEVFVGQMGVMYAVEAAEDGRSRSLREKLALDYTPLVGFCIMLFILISMPCAATFVVTWRESGSLKWPLLQVAYLTVTAWIVTTAVFQIASLVP